MLLSTHIFAVVLYLPLFVGCIPTTRWSHFMLPPPLSAEKLSLVRANAINISTHRFVCALIPPSS